MPVDLSGKAFMDKIASLDDAGRGALMIHLESVIRVGSDLRRLSRSRTSAHDDPRVIEDSRLRTPMKSAYHDLAS